MCDAAAVEEIDDTCENECYTEVASTMLTSTICFDTQPYTKASASGVHAKDEDESSTPAETGAARPLTLTTHLIVQRFVDYVWVILTEDENCVPGVILRYDVPPISTSVFMYNKELPTVECEVLLGVRDHALTNVLARALAHMLGECGVIGENRSLLMCINVMRTAARLTDSPMRIDYVNSVKKETLRLCMSA